MFNAVNVDCTWVRCIYSESEEVFIDYCVIRLSPSCSDYTRE